MIPADELARLRELTDEQIVAIRKATVTTDFETPWADSIAFARALLDALEAPTDDARVLTTTEQIREYLDVLTAEGHTEDARDAARYRWLRERVDSRWWHGQAETGEVFDAAVDAAIADAAISPKAGDSAPLVSDDGGLDAEDAGQMKG